MATIKQSNIFTSFEQLESLGEARIKTRIIVVLSDKLLSLELREILPKERECELWECGNTFAPVRNGMKYCSQACNSRRKYLEYCAKIGRKAGKSKRRKVKYERPKVK